MNRIAAIIRRRLGWIFFALAVGAALLGPDPDPDPCPMPDQAAAHYASPPTQAAGLPGAGAHRR